MLRSLGALAAVALGTALALPACSGSQAIPDVDTPATAGFALPQAPESALFLRASFDDDPSSYMGRFLPDKLGAHDIDENRAAQTRCSRFVTYKKVRAGGHREELLQASTSVGASVGYKDYVKVGGGYKGGVSVRVEYDLQEKMVPVLTDPDGFHRCCEAAPDQCGQRYLGEFISGTGKVFQAVGREIDVKTKIPTLKGVDADIAYKDGVAWKRLTSFENMYFAFRPALAQLGQGQDYSAICHEGFQLPTSLDGQFFVGTSQPARSEQMALNDALLNGRRQAVNFLGQWLQQSVTKHQDALAGHLQNDDVIRAASEGIASYVKDRFQCPVGRIVTPDGPLYTHRVLVFFPEASKAEASQKLLGAVSEQLRASGKGAEARRVDEATEAVPR